VSGHTTAAAVSIELNKFAVSEAITALAFHPETAALYTASCTGYVYIHGTQ
jgi:hypothetical protein